MMRERSVRKGVFRRGRFAAGTALLVALTLVAVPSHFLLSQPAEPASRDLPGRMRPEVFVLVFTPFIEAGQDLVTLKGWGNPYALDREYRRVVIEESSGRFVRPSLRYSREVDGYAAKSNGGHALGRRRRRPRRW